MRILLSNDDSIHAAGFGVLEKVARSLTDDVWVCAPESEQSGASHSLTIHRPLRLRQLSEKRFACDGTPTDCVLLAINHIMKDNPPDLVLSGVNHGCNIAEDVTYSGTIAAAMEATLLGVRSIALSQDIPPHSAVDFGPAEHWAAKVIEKVIAVEWPSEVLVNVNFPSCPAIEVKGIEVVPQGPRKIGDELFERTDPRGRSYFWIGMARLAETAPANSDTSSLAEGNVTVTPIHMNLTHEGLMEPLRTALA